MVFNVKVQSLFGLLCLLLFIGIFLPKEPLPVTASLGDDYFEDFEGSAFSAWTATGLWHVEDYNNASDPLGGIPSGTKYAWYGNATTENYETYDINNTDTPNLGELISDRLDLTGFTGQTFLTFWSWAETEEGDYYDQKNILISIDGGISWSYLGNVIVEGEPSWQLIYFDISSYLNSSNVYIKFSFDTVDSAANNYRGWCLDDIEITSDFEIPEYFELWIDQDYYARVGETRWMTFNVLSYFNHTMPNVTIGVVMVGPESNSSLYYNENVYISNYGHWNITLGYTFTYSGHYDVFLYLIDDIGEVWDKWCYWEVEPEHFYLWIDQDNFGLVGNYSWMYFYVESYFGHDMNVTIKIEMFGPSTTTVLYSNSSVLIPAGGVWTINLNYLFPESGHYDVQLTLTDDIGDQWVTSCWYEVFDDPEFLWLQIFQDMNAEVGETRWIDFQVYSNFSYPLTNVEIYVEIATPTSGNHSLYWSSNTTLYSQNYWWTSTEYTFYEPGDYYVFFYVRLATGERWTATCWWEVYDKPGDAIEMWINQDYEALVGQEVYHEFHVKTHFAEPLLVNIEIVIEHQGVVLFNDEMHDIILEPEAEWVYSLYFTFHEPGFYDVYFYLEDANDHSVNWECYCWWDIYEGDMALSIDFSSSITVNETEIGVLRVTNYSNETHDFYVIASVSDQQGTDTPVFEEMVHTLYPGDTWQAGFNLTFDTVGQYKLWMIVNSTAGQYYTEFEFEVLPEKPLTSEDPQTTTIPSLSPGFELYLLPIVILTIVYLRKRK